ncbi:MULTISPECIES: hypothetical protein [unclassified Nocardiopsis]|uniref:hypothetical protein n=1 Tax=unclassified Nocardiopsis TaxID=2649073 RepID=UPI0019154C09|nr:MULTISPECIES: hypothetical protein [unclassified Nocardiopsis]
MAITPSPASGSAARVPSAARYTLHVTQRGRDLAIEVHLFGRFAPDGRMRSSHMLTRTVPA